MTKLSGLYAITDSKLMESDLIDKTEQAILGGINILQYRNKSAPLKQQQQEALKLAQLCKKNNVLFLINDNIELALQVDADGVHLGQTDASLQQAREQLGKNKIIGITCHNQIGLAQKAQAQGADYVAFGRFFNSETKPSAPAAEVSLLRDASKVIQIPIVAIGGVTTENAPLLLKEGADILAVINAVFGQKDVSKAAQKFIEIISSPKVIG